MHETPLELRQFAPQTAGSTHGDHHRVVISFGPLVAPQYGGLRPMVEIDRYGEHEKVVVGNVINKHVLPPVTMVFAG